MSTDKKIKARNALLRNSLAAFNRKSFHTLNQGEDYSSNWHVKLICEYLEACYDGEITRLNINIPPRYMKSLNCSIGFPAWVLGHDPTESIVCVSHTSSLSLSLSHKCRTIVQSGWYQQVFPHTRINPDSNKKSHWQTTSMGHRIATSVGGSITGEGGNYIIIDDAIDPEKAEQKKIRQKTNTWIDETLKPRLNDVETGVIINVQHRLHDNDVSGHLLAQSEEWESVDIAALPEKKRVYSYGSVHKVQEALEPIDPERHSREVLTKWRENEIGDFAFAAQYNQDPKRRSGGLFERENFEIVRSEEVPRDGITIRYWDLAGTVPSPSNPDPSYTATVKARYTDPDLWILHVDRFRKSPGDVEDKIEHYVQEDEDGVIYRAEQEGGSAGKKDILNLARNIFQGKDFQGIKPSGSKVVRANPLARATENGWVHVLSAGWNQMYLDELEAFPGGSHDDMVDCTSGCYNEVTDGDIGVGALV